MFPFSVSVNAGILSGTNGDVRLDVDRDVFLLFNVVDENQSWYLEENIQKCTDAANVDPTDSDFTESNLMHCEKLFRRSSPIN